MKTIAALFSVLLFTNLATAGESDDSLRRALTRLHDNVRVARVSKLDQLNDFALGVTIGGVALGIAGNTTQHFASTLGRRGTISMNVTRRMQGMNMFRLLPLANTLVAAGIVIYAGTGIARLFDVTLPETPQPAAYYKTSAKRMNEFFALNLERQYEVAAGDAELTQFILDLQSAYDSIDRDNQLR